MNSKRQRAVILLSDGLFLEGFAIGLKSTSTGEICFNTGMTGYQEVFSDPSYAGQILVETQPHVGNYGVHPDEMESVKGQIAGLVVKNFSQNYSRFQASGSLQDWLVAQKIVGISDVDTRMLVRHIRHKGAMNSVISSEIFDQGELTKILNSCPSMEGLELSSVVSTKEAYSYGNPEAGFRIAALDFGIKTNILRSLAARDCFIRVFPAKTNLTTLNEFNPDGYFLSNGPGDPAVMPYAVETVNEMLKTNKPLFGICLGHQILSLTQGISTYKMFNGHRGINHPVKNLISGHSEITSQNHGFAVNLEDAKNNSAVEISHVNLNDQTLEGIRIKNRKAFSVQYHPESSPGPHDSRYLFDEFVGMMKTVTA